MQENDRKGTEEIPNQHTAPVDARLLEKPVAGSKEAMRGAAYFPKDQTGALPETPLQVVAQPLRDKRAW